MTHQNFTLPARPVSARVYLCVNCKEKMIYLRYYSLMDCLKQTVIGIKIFNMKIVFHRRFSRSNYGNFAQFKVYLTLL